MLRPWSMISTLVFGGLLVLTLGSIEAGSSLSYTCVLCRLGRVDTTLFGFTRSTYHETDCSRWYSENIEPSHTHIWERGTCMTLLNAFAQPMGVGCRPGHYRSGFFPRPRRCISTSIPRTATRRRSFSATLRMRRPITTGWRRTSDQEGT